MVSNSQPKCGGGEYGDRCACITFSQREDKIRTKMTVYLEGLPRHVRDPEFIHKHSQLTCREPVSGLHWFSPHNRNARVGPTSNRWLIHAPQFKLATSRPRHTHQHLETVPIKTLTIHIKPSHCLHWHTPTNCYARLVSLSRFQPECKRLSFLKNFLKCLICQIC